VTILLIESLKNKKQYIIISMGGKDLKNQEVSKIAKWIAEGNVKITAK
jgi:cell division GTPase FtsZ